jgi:LysR family glycine cleavage system transcriptional activator
VPRSLPSLTALRAFEAAARHQSFKDAAAELSVTHAAISRQVRDLEVALDTALFVRLNRRVVLTEAGRAYSAVLRRAFDDIAAATRRLDDVTARGRLVLLVEPALASRWLVHRLKVFRARHPDVEVEIKPAPGPVDIPRDLAHAAICYGRSGRPGVRHDLLFALRAFPVCTPAVAAGPPPLRRPADLAGHRLLHEVSTEWWQRWLEAAGAADVDWTRGPIYHDAILALDAALEGEGVAIGDSLLAYPDLEAGRLVKPFDFTLATGAYYFISPDTPAEPPKLAAFRAWLLAEAAAQARASERWERDR